MFSYVGIEYSSPPLTAALGNLTPVFTFLIALVFRSVINCMNHHSSRFINYPEIRTGKIEVI